MEAQGPAWAPPTPMNCADLATQMALAPDHNAALPAERLKPGATRAETVFHQYTTGEGHFAAGPRHARSTAN